MIFNRAKRHRRAGDGYRAAQNWVMAEASYRLHLALDPADAAIWVQLGHALKEQGRMADAATAYGRGAALEPDNADTQQHWQFAQDQVRDAAAPAAAAAAGLPLPPGLVAEDVPPPPPVRRRIVHQPAVLPEGIILFSVQDLFGYLRAHTTMSGIQRVQAGIALHAILTEGDKVGFIVNDQVGELRDGEFLLTGNALVRDMIEYASGSVVDHQILRDKLDACEDEATIARPGAGHTIILLGAFWGLGNTVDRFVTPRRDGAKVGAYIYDIIPISHPQYCDAMLVVDFTRSISELSMIVDFIFTISDYSRLRLQEHYRASGLREIPMTTVPLAHSLTAGNATTAHWPDALKSIRGRRYVAYVSTIEGRKNHAYVVQAWQQLIEEGVDVPELVFVGRKGWRINGLLDLLDATHNLDGRVHIVHDLTDAELNTVYAQSAFTVFTSYVEGWGLPVGESLVQTVPCVASSTSSIPEVGGDFVDYVDPLNLRAGIETLRRMIVDTEYLAARRRQIADSFVARSWQDVGRDFLDKTKAAVAIDYAERPIYPTLPEGSLFRPGDLLIPVRSTRTQQVFPARLLLGQSFFAIEPHGAWMNGNRGSVTFQTVAAPGTSVIVYVELKMAPGADGRHVTIGVGEAGSGNAAGERPYRLDAGRRTILRAIGTVAAGGVCTVRIEVSGEIALRPNDTRLFMIGLAAVGYARLDNSAAREELVEQFFIHDMTAIV